MATSVRQPTIYMAGPIQHARDNGKGWRERVKDRYPRIDWRDPLEKYDGTAEAAEWEDEKVVAEDKAMIDDCDGVLLHYETVPSWGTPREHEYAAANGIPVFVQTTETDPSPWLTVDAEVVAETFEEAVGAIEGHFNLIGET